VKSCNCSVPSVSMPRQERRAAFEDCVSWDTVPFKLLYELLIMGEWPAPILRLGVTTYPTVEWIAINSRKPPAGSRHRAI
jgi:hypothetical protein